jgi:flavin reductase (DIM6/NTAB) family NADH-FMN oxidoreductase RutF
LKTTAPVLHDAYAAYECKLLDSKPYGDHVWIVGEIVAVHFLEEAFTAAGVLHIDKTRPLLYIGSDTYASIDEDTVKLVKRGI